MFSSRDRWTVEWLERPTLTLGTVVLEYDSSIIIFSKLLGWRRKNNIKKRTQWISPTEPSGFSRITARRLITNAIYFLYIYQNNKQFEGARELESKLTSRSIWLMVYLGTLLVSSSGALRSSENGPDQRPSWTGSNLLLPTSSRSTSQVPPTLSLSLSLNWIEMFCWSVLYFLFNFIY